jgi:trehalose-6-phosphatase
MGPHSRFGGLYEDAKKRQERQAKLAEAILDNNCTFKPDTSATKNKNEVLIQKNNVNLGGEAR